MANSENPLDRVLAYHSRTKHHVHRFAASLGYLDWATQPDPFRVFGGAPEIELPFAAAGLTSVQYSDLYSSGVVPALPLNLDSVGVLFELALGLSAWKQYQNTRWALRCNPSSGNLHPTEGYAILPKCPGIDAGVYHYLPKEHSLERRCALEPWPGKSLLVGLSSIHWREAWKYGERAFRYCQHDMGHAIASVRYAAGVLGWTARLLDVSDPEIVDLLGLADAEAFSRVTVEDREHPGALMRVGPAGDFAVPATVALGALRRAARAGSWVGYANALSPDHAPWPVIDDVAQATLRDGQDDAPVSLPTPAVAITPVAASSPTGLSAVTLIQQRRSAVALDEATSMPVQTFYRILDRLLPRPGVAPWDVLPWPPYLHCGLFVHRVDGLTPGLYLLERRPFPGQELRSRLRPEFLYERPLGCPKDLPFFKLTDGDFRAHAQSVSCQQKIAGAGAFSLGMIAEFEGSLRTNGASWYRRLFWEAGVLGHVLYLEAEAAGLRGTGIGCYFDDAFHSILGLQGGLQDAQFQSLYHFTIGAPIEDTRLMTLPAYAHLKRNTSTGK